MTTQILLSRGKEALVDDEDGDRIGQFDWYAMRAPRTWYATGRAGGRALLLMHRFILGLGSQDPDIDHINGNGLDNRRENLRLATASQNLLNQWTIHPHKTARFKGVHWDSERGLWLAQIKVDGQHVFLGRFGDEDEAARAYDRASSAATGTTNVMLGRYLT